MATSAFKCIYVQVWNAAEAPDIKTLMLKNWPFIAPVNYYLFTENCEY